MARNPSDPPSFMEQVMEICDRVLDQQPGTSERVHHDRPEGVELPEAPQPESAL